MKFVDVTLLMCAFSLTLFALSPKTYSDAETGSRSKFDGECKNFGPNEPVNCDNTACTNKPKTIMETDPLSWTSNGRYSLARRTTTCKLNFPGCEDSFVEYYERVEDAGCCDLDRDGYYGSQCEGNDCNDTNSNVNPGKAESCDGIDNNCNNQSDEGYDQDGDGWTTCNGDCRDDEDWINPGVSPCPPGGGYYDKNCNGSEDEYECSPSPIAIDVQGNGFSMTNTAGGVNFDLNGDGTRERLSWTAPNSDDAWLALDRNSNGMIDNGQELFGNFTSQPIPPPRVVRNGFLALAEFDKPSNGGNRDGQIDSRDTVFPLLRLWRDANQNGISETSELRTLTSLGIVILDLDYEESKRTDQYGNQFLYRAKVKDAQGAHVGRWAWDVFLIRQP